MEFSNMLERCKLFKIADYLLTGRAAELGQQPQLHYFSVPGKKSATVPGPTCEPVTGS